MGQIEQLASEYFRHVSAPWSQSVTIPQRVLLVVYDPAKERALRSRLGEFEQATRRAGHGWQLVNCTPWVAEWMAKNEYCDAYFADPSLASMAYAGDLKPMLIGRLKEAFRAADEDTVVALLGVASFYGFASVSELIAQSAGAIRGRLLVFFPGRKNGNVYRLLDARDGWNYLATGITVHGGANA